MRGNYTIIPGNFTVDFVKIVTNSSSVTLFLVVLISSTKYFESTDSFTEVTPLVP